jgi:hypothetical protein
MLQGVKIMNISRIKNYLPSIVVSQPSCPTPQFHIGKLDADTLHLQNVQASQIFNFYPKIVLISRTLHMTSTVHIAYETPKQPTRIHLCCQSRIANHSFCQVHYLDSSNVTATSAFSIRKKPTNLKQTYDDLKEKNYNI